MQQVERDIGRADFVLAILTGLNPNVMLELGLAKKPAILIIDDAQKLPFDVRHRRSLVYGGPGELATLAPRLLAQALRETADAALRARAESLSLRSSFAGLLAEHGTGFAGRDAELAQPRRACQDPAKRYVLLTAPQGFGKTALLAALVASDPDTYAYHFLRPNPDARERCRGLLPPERRPADGGPAWRQHRAAPLLPELRVRFHSLASAPLESPRVLGLDGVDEITTWRLDRYLPRQPAPGLCIVVSARDDGRNWIETLGLSADTTTHMSLHGLSRGSACCAPPAARRPHSAPMRR
jgi:hypothetical protein